jgi:HEAT repeat protein
LDQALLTMMRSDEAEIRNGACAVLAASARSNGLAAGVLKELTSMLRHGDAGIKRNAANVLGHAGKKCPLDAIAALVDALVDPDENVRGQAGIALERIGAVALPALRETLNQREPGGRERVAELLATANFREDQAVPQLVVTLLKDNNANVRAKAARSLRSFSRQREIVLSDLLLAARDKEASVRREAVAALGFFETGAKDVVPVLIQALSDKDEGVAEQAVEALAIMGPKAKDAVPALVERVKDSASPLCCPAIRALRNIGPQARAAVPILLQGLTAKGYEEARRDLIRSLGAIGPDAKSAVPALLDILKGKDSMLQLEAATALGRMGQGAKDAVPDLIKVLEDKNDPDLQIAAAEALGRIGPAASAAERTLERAASGSGELAEAARRALRRISSK